MRTAILLVLAFLFACAQRTGGDVDEHGCIPSAGYSWCEEKQKCLRTWEEPCVDDSAVTDFDSCVEAGYPVMESYPRQCKTANGQLFVEVTGELSEISCLNAGGHWNECSNKCQLANQGIDDAICTMECQALCECGGLAGFACPEGFDCVIESTMPDALGYCG